MQRNLSGAKLSIAVFCLYLLASGMPAIAMKKPEKPPVPSRQFSREEFMVLNLNKGNDSTGAHISESLRQVRQMIKDLDKSLRQLQQAEREFGKSKGRPDDHFLAPAAAKLEQSLKTAQQLEQELSQSRDELKDSIHHALIMAQ